MYVQPKHKCLSCYFEIKDGQEESFIREHQQMRYYHTNWQDCQDALRGFQPRQVTMKPNALREGTAPPTEETVDA